MAAVMDEMLLLERVFLRVGSAESDEQLQNVVCKFLPPVLLKLSSPQEGVRKKVMELLVHINKRLKSRPQVQVPVESLLVQYQDPAASAFIINFTIIYIRLGFPRLPMEKKAELAPTLLVALDGKPVQHKDSLFLLLMPVLGHIKVPADPAVRGSVFGLAEKPQIAKQFADFMLDMLLLPYGSMLAGSAQQPSTPGDQSSDDPAAAMPPGLCESALKKLVGEGPMSSEELEKIKLGIVKFLSSGVYPDADVLCHLVVASADSRFSVANAADFELRKIIGSLDWSSVAMLNPLFMLYLGTQSSKPNQANPVKPELCRAPAGTRLRLKLLPCLTRAKGSAVIFPLCIQVFFDSLFSSNTNTKLRGLALNFCLNVIKNVNRERLVHVAHVLLSGLLKLLAEGEPSLRGQSYNVIGQLALNYPTLVNKDLVLLTNFMEALGKEETQDVKLSIREALLTMVDAFRPECATTETSNNVTNGAGTSARAGPSRPVHKTPESLPPELLQLQMQELLTRQIVNPESMVRFVVVRYAAAAFDQKNVASRFLLLLASADSKEEVATEAQASLYRVPQSTKDLGPRKTDVSGEKGALVLPLFLDMVKYVSEQMQKAGKQTAFTSETFIQIVKYLRLCMARSANVVIPASETLMHPSEHTPKIGRYLQQLIETQKEVINEYLTLVQKLLAVSPGPVPILALLEIVGCIPRHIAPQFANKLTTVQGLLRHTSEEMRELTAFLFGVIAANGLESDAVLDRIVAEICKDTMNKKTLLEQQHGQLLAMAHAVERFITHCRARGAEDSSDIMAWPTYKTVILTIYSFLDNSSPMLVGGACSALTLLARCAELPLPNGKNDNDENPGKMDVLLRLQSVMSSNKMTSKVKERAVKAAGHLCVGEKFPHSREIIEGFLSMAKEGRDVEVHLSVGEALVCCVLGPASPESRDPWTVMESEFKPPLSVGSPADSEESIWLYDKMLKEMAKVSHPNQRQACCLWLLALLKNCSSSASLSSRLPEIQAVFMEFLAENNDIVQDAASKGLGLVYEATSPEHRKKLVAELLDTLMSGRRAVQQVTADTQIFNAGEIGKAPGGNNLTTYKELCSLASDLNQPDLIYKFMHLANHNSMWNSKKGAAFGFSTIAATAGDQLTPHLPKIVPRLYRYQFDPTPKIQNSMASIWHTLVPETSKTVDLYHKEILADLIQNLTANQWRVRQSSCLAIADFIRGSSKRNIQDDIESLPELWSQLFRVMDDVHDGTRQAAVNTTRTLSKICIRGCDASQGKSGQEMVKTILPVLLQTGICNTVSEVRSVSLQTVSQLVNVAGPQLKPHLPILLPALLEAAGELESSGLAYLSTRYGADAERQEMIDSVRASAAKSHYSTETMTKCLQFMDEDILNQVIPRVVELLKHSVGLGTKVAATHFLVMLSHPMKTELQPHAGKLLTVLVNGLQDRNTAVRKCNASAIGHIVSSAKESSLEKLFAKLKDWYFQKEDENIRSAVGYTFRAISQHNQDVLSNYMDQAVPLMFFAMHAKKTPESTAAVEVWEDVWNEATPGTETALRMHLTSICALLKQALQSNSWTVKAQAATAVGTLATKMGATLKPAQCSELIDILLSGLPGRTWEGKESLLQALATLTKSCREILLKPESRPMVDAIVLAALKEAKKEQPEYKLKALPALAAILETLQMDCFTDFYELVKDYLNKKEVAQDEEEDDAMDADENSKQHEQWLKLREVAFESLGKAWPSTPSTQAQFQQDILEACVSCLNDSTRPVQAAVVLALISFVDRMSLLQPSNRVSEDMNASRELTNILAQLDKALHISLGISHSTRIRKESLNVLLSLAKKLKDCGQQEHLVNLAKSFTPVLERLSKDTTPEIKSRVVDLRSFFGSL